MLKNGPERFILTDERYINKFLGIEITHIDEKRFKVLKPLLIDRNISLINIDTNNYGMDTNNKATTVGKPLLYTGLSGKPRKEAWNYQTAVGMLNHLQGNSRTDISMSLNQTTHFYNNPVL